MHKDELGDRMKKNYEDRFRVKLTRRIPVILRLDGKAFHTLTKHCEKPFDEKFINAMKQAAFELLNEIQGAKCAYVQSDEVSILLTDFDKLETEAWFDYNLQKIVSVSASMMSVLFTKKFGWNAVFDARAFNVPKEEVCNYFVWRQKDWIRNSIQMLGQANFSHKELQYKDCKTIEKMLVEKHISWYNLEDELKYGTFIFTKDPDMFFSSDIMENRELIENHLYPKN